jgi:hypothetical protein
VADELISLYLTYIESTQRIIHVPTFLRDVEEFWSSYDNPSIHSAAFVAQLLLVLACAWNFADVTSLQEKSPTPLRCYTALEWVLHAEKWITNARIKRPEINTLRLYILLITAQNSFGMKRSQAWIATSQMVKSAMMSGYHRDPSKYARISTFNKEMRRRIWVTIVELDLQVAIDRGMPPTVQASDYDTLPPLNINDDELHETTIEAPEEHPIGDATDCSYQTALGQSLPVRLKACSLMHSPRLSCRYEEIQRLDWELTRHLSQIPTWYSAEASDPLTRQKVMLWKASIEIKLAHSLLSVHTPFAIEARHEALFAPSARSRLDAAIMILSTQRRLHETSPMLSLCILGEWTLHAFISICQVLHSLNSQACMTYPMFLYLDPIKDTDFSSECRLLNILHLSTCRPIRLSRLSHVARRDRSHRSGSPVSVGRQGRQGLFLPFDDRRVSESEALASPSNDVQAASGGASAILCPDAVPKTRDLRAPWVSGYG